MRLKNPLTISWIREIQNSIRIILIELLAIVMFSGISVAQPHHRADLKNVPVIDMHSHPTRALYDKSSPEEYDKEIKFRIAAMDAMGVKKQILLSHGFETTKAPNEIQVNSEKEGFYFIKAAPDRFVFFTTVDFSQMNSPDFSAKAIEHLEKTVREGARGMKFELGKPLLHFMPMDDPRLDPIYDKAAELGIPIMFHCNDPEDFFYPINQFNFWLGANKGKEGTEQGYWGRLDKFVSREQLMHERENMFHKHPNTTFIMAHFGFLERQLPLCADIFDRYPNVYVEVSVALDNLARSPKEGAAFLTKYSTRIMFGIDEGTRPVLQGGWEGFYNRYFAIFELDQDDLPVLKQPRAWTTVHGLNLSKEVLERIYYKNAEELLARPVHLPLAR